MKTRLHPATEARTECREQALPIPFYRFSIMHASPRNVFVYGTLLVPKIWTAVTGAPDLIEKPATLSGHRIARVRGGDFPVITQIDDETSMVKGAIRFDVPPDALRRLDKYEDGFYLRETISAKCEGEAIAADVYRVSASNVTDLFSDDHWTLEWFEKNALDRYWNRHFG